MSLRDTPAAKAVNIEHLKTNPTDQLKIIYADHRQEFVAWLTRLYHCETEDAAEAFQSAVATLYENIVSDKLKLLDCSIKTYLYAIGKNKYLEMLKAGTRINGHISSMHKMTDYTQECDGFMHSESESRELQLQAIEKGLHILGEPGRTILELYYYHHKSMEEIACLLGYKNSETAKNLKYKSLQRLKKIVTDHIKPLYQERI